MAYPKVDESDIIAGLKSSEDRTWKRMERILRTVKDWYDSDKLTPEMMRELEDAGRF